MARRKSDNWKPGKEYPGQMEAGSGRLEDDAALWARVAETAEPLTKKNRFIDLEAPFEAPARPMNQAKAKRPAAPGASTRGSMFAKPQRQAIGDRVAVKHAPSPKAGLDRQTARKLDKGNLAIEARIDLHGMRQRDAHSALRKFLHWARGKDYRHVLVITGKGSLRDTASFRAEERSFYEEEPRGVLRQAVPQWLSHGDLALMIVSFSEAPRRLGGGGALYVRLRKSDHERRKP